jgi:hypothetical protein
MLQEEGVMEGRKEEVSEKERERGCGFTLPPKTNNTAVSAAAAQIGSS